MEKAFTRVNWENTPSMATPLNEDNLNEGDAALDIIDDRVIVLDTTKANQSDLLQSVKSITYDTTTGVFVFTWWNGTTLNVDLNIEKIPVTFSMDANGVITMTTADGSTYTADVGSLIKQYSFVDSSEIDFTVTVDAQTGNKSITAAIKDGSITDSKLQPNYLSDITIQAQRAASSATSAASSASDADADAKLAQSYAVGTEGVVRDIDATDNAKYYKEQAEQAAADAESAAHVTTMTLSTNGIGRPDGTTITVDANGVFTATSGQVFIYPDPNVLPSASTANDKAIYLIDDPTATGADICTEWVVVTTNGVKTWKQIGDTSVDLSGYATTTQLNTKVNKTDIANIEATGTTNTTGSTIRKDTYFWLNGSFVKAKTDIAVNATFVANSNYETANDVLNSFEGGSGGHTIENASGTALIQRDTLQFKGGLSVSDDSTNEVTVVDDTYPEIPWSTWQAMTPTEQSEYPNAVITGAPDSGGGEGSTESIEAIVNLYGSKNLVPYPYLTIGCNETKTQNGITFTDNGDGTITASGTASAQTLLYLSPRLDNIMPLQTGTFKGTGCPQNGSVSKFRLLFQFHNTSTSKSVWYTDLGNGVEFSYESANNHKLFCYLVIESGMDLTTPITFKPMIRDARISDDTWVPYAMTNKELTDNKTDKTDVSSISIIGSTNTSGSTITAGTWFYLNDKLVKAKVNISNNAIFTKDTNYEEKTIGSALSELNSNIGRVNYLTTYNNVIYSPGSNATQVSVPVFNPNLYQFSIDNVIVYIDDGNFVDIAADCQIVSIQKNYVQVKIQFNSSYVGKTVRIGLK